MEKIINLRLWIAAAVLFLMALGGGYYAWKRSVQQDALVQWNADQIKKLADSQKVFAEQTARLAELTKDISTELARQRAALEIQLESIENFLDSPESIAAEQKSGLSSEVLRETVRRLDGSTEHTKPTARGPQ